MAMQPSFNGSNKKSSGPESKKARKRIPLKTDSEHNLRDAINASEILSSNISLKFLKSIFIDNRNIDLIIADSKVMSFPEIISNSTNLKEDSYLPIFTLPFGH